VVADYALTQVYTPPSFYVREIADATRASTSGLPPELTRAFATMPQEVVEVMTGSDPEVMRHALAVIDAEHDGPVNLAKSRFGLTDASIEALRAAYLI
jgi:protein-tyrosine phosphatase